jgi:hypothetical protein
LRRSDSGGGGLSLDCHPAFVQNLLTWCRQFFRYEKREIGVNALYSECDRCETLAFAGVKAGLTAENK